MLNADRWQLSGRGILCFSTPWMSPDGEYGTLGAGGGGGGLSGFKTESLTMDHRG